MTKTEMAEEMDTESTGGGSLLRPVKLFLLHIVFFTLSLLLSFLGYDNMQMGDWWFPDLFLYWLGFTLIVKLTIFGILHQYQGWWRYASVSDLLSIIKGSHFSTLIIVVLWFFVQEFGVAKFVPALKQMPHAVMLMDWAATIVVICGVRLAIRLYYEETQTVSSGRLSRLLVVGAGNAGEVLLREIHRMGETRYEVVGFIDDDPKKIGVRIHGVPVLASCEKIKEIAKKRNIDEIVIAMPSATHKQMRRVVELCRGTNLRFSTVPDLVAIASGQVKVSQIRDVDINDLLGREPVRLDTEQISRFIKDKVILITGAGGSIGSEMCRQVSQFQPRTLLLLEQAENGLFFVERELRRNFPQIDYRAIICDIVDRKRVDWVFETYGPKVVFHAAAHKHVPLMELNPGEAIKNNVIGTRNVAEAADQFGSSHFVMISTDKAVNPTSIMGSSKRIAEMTIQCLNKRSNTDYVTVRFGNVLGSNGSVIPIFKDQIAAGGPVTVTHPEMQRYFMTIPEASQLVLQSATMGQGGEVFVLDMGEPVKIVDLARDLITLSGFRPGEDIEIKFTGMRPGEKLFEELAMTGENMQPTRHPKIGIWKNLPPDEKSLRHTIDDLLATIEKGADREEIVAIIKQIVPEYVGDVDFMKLHREHITKNNHAH